MADLADMPTTSPDRSRRARRGALLAAFVTVALAAGCGGSGGSTGAGSGGAKADTLVIANAVNVDTLDPAANSVNESIWMTQNIYQRLLQPNANGTDVIPQLAESWDISDDGLTYTFHLGDHKFSDGSPVTAEDVRYSIQRSINYDGGWGFLLEAVKSVEAPDPMPRCANPRHSSTWLAPPKRITSAARYASRASSMLGVAESSSQASYMIWIQRRLPGHAPTDVFPSAHDF